MNIFNYKFINSKINILKISIFISLFFHFLILLLLYRNPISNTKGDKYIPIELININSFTGAGESLNKKIEKDLQKINKSNKDKKIEREKSENLKQDETFKSLQKENNNKINQKETNKFKKEKINLNSSDKTQFKMQRGSASDQEQNDMPEKGSVKGKSKIKITCLKCVSPKYPTRALRRGAEGKPLVKVWINKSGKVTKSEIINSSGNESIDNAALSAADKSTFYPLKTETTLKIEYDLKIRK